ncbi:MAG: D-glycero-beta-D-manno-heptose 1,7-bisphosphate 7-phosphatase [Gammaproteobacteria bacterium]
MDRARLVILDRDGVINRDRTDFVKSPEEWVALPGSLEAIALLSRAGFTVAVATNQSGLGRGLFDRDTLEAVHEKMRFAAEESGGRIDIIAYCPHRPEDGCACRKPLPGLLSTIAGAYGVELAGVPCIGDSQRDLDAARAVGARAILVLTGNGEATSQALDEGDDVEVFPDLLAATRCLLEGPGSPC